MSKESPVQPISTEYTQHLRDTGMGVGKNMRNKYINTAFLSGMLALFGILFDHAAFVQAKAALYEIGSRADYTVKALIAGAGLTSLIATVKGLVHERSYRKAKKDLQQPGTNGKDAIAYLESNYHKAGYQRDEPY